MEIRLMRAEGLSEALFGIGLSYGITSDYVCWDAVPFDKVERLKKTASVLCRKGGGEDKFLRQIMFWWDVTAPRYWWAEADTYKVATTAQSESTMHTIMKRPLEERDFEYSVPGSVRNSLNRMYLEYSETKDERVFFELKNVLPEGFLQRRIWTLNLANMKNIYRQRKNHRLPQWRQVCEAFVEATPEFLRGMYE
ncbi:MAG: hypothetical protein IKE76_12655 [Clostridia bacterium]|nr:hypothetical protein [Clostridia bacterium]